MKIYLREITDQETELNFTQENEWVLKAVQRVDEPTEDTALARLRNHTTKKPRPIHCHLSLRKVDEVVVVTGKLHTFVELVCSRCANPFHFDCRLSFSALFCKDPIMAGVAHLQEAGRPAGQNKGHARHAHEEESGETGTSTDRDLDITYLSDDFIDLAEVLTEQLQLQIPFQPLCRESCKGICHQCGADLNVGRCACAKIAPTHPFAALKNLKI